MNNPFQSGSSSYPVRWFLVLIAALTVSMSYIDFTGWRFLSSTANQRHGNASYYGSHYYHK
jgi:hypothetical protein